MVVVLRLDAHQPGASRRRRARRCGPHARRFSKEHRSRIFERQAVLPIGSTQSGLATQKGPPTPGSAINTAPSPASAAPAVGALNAGARKLAGIITLGKASIAALNKGGSAERKRTPPAVSAVSAAPFREARAHPQSVTPRSGPGLTAATQTALPIVFTSGVRTLPGRKGGRQRLFQHRLRKWSW